MTDFFNKTDLSRKDAENIVSNTLKNCDDGELYLENRFLFFRYKK